jgi:hypothetical protein
VLQRTLTTALIVDRRWQGSALQHAAHGGSGLHHLLPQIVGNRHLPPAVRAGVVNGAPADALASHLFQAQRLCRQLNIIMLALAPRPVLVFDRVRGSVRKELDDIRFAHQPETVAIQGQRAHAANVPLYRKARRIDLGVHRLPASGVHVVGEGLLLVNQGALARTIAPVLQSG